MKTMTKCRRVIGAPHQDALVDTPDDGWWFQDAGIYGHLIHLQPVEWKDGWPLMGKNGEPMRQHAKPIIIRGQKPSVPHTSDEFDGDKLGLQWQWHANQYVNWHSLTVRPSWLRLFPQPAVTTLGEQPNLLLQRFPSRNFAVETELELFALEWGEEAGLVVMGSSYVALTVRYDGVANRIVLRTNDKKLCELGTASNKVRLRVEVLSGGNCFFSVVDNGDFVSIPQAFQATKSKWIGAKVGLYSLKQVINAPAGHADFDYFRFL